MSDLDSLMRNAIASQMQGDFVTARSIYQQLLAEHGDLAPAFHNLGVMALNENDLASAVANIQRAFLLEPDAPELLTTIRNLAMALYHNHFWEQARDWFEIILTRYPQDQEVIHLVERIAPRDYLAPEIYDEKRQQVLKRYSPREGASYIYTIDIVGTCNLRCPTCPVGNFPEAERATGFMPYELFEKILAKIDREKITDTPEIFLFNWGEPLLHPELSRFIELANAYGFPVTLSTNLNIKTDLEPMVAANPATLKISMSGISQNTYGETHKRGKIELFKANLFKLKVLMEKYQSSTRVYLGHHLYTHNQSELADVAALCQDLGFGHAPIQAFFQPLEKLKQVLDGELDSTTLPVLDMLPISPQSRLERLRQTRPGHYDCELRFNQTVINHDGSVALCCGVYDKPNMLGVGFLDEDHDTLQRRKYQHEFCLTCKKYEMDYSPIHLPVD